jgi:hypothetical protein
MEEHQSRRQFCIQAVTASAGAAAALAMNPAAKANHPKPGYSIPGHLPPKLTISCWQWAWLTAALPDEPYGDLEKVMVGLAERGFNTIRIDAGLNWCFQADGSPRGEVEFCQLFKGYGSRHRVIYGRGGGRFNVLDRLMALMRLAKQHDIYVILSSWEYMHSTSQLADETLRAEVYGVPEDQRLMRLAQHHDRLLRILKEKDLHKNIAFVEPHNEANISDLSKQQPRRASHEEAIAFLRDRHPDILISGDMAGHHPKSVPENTQVYDNHMYAGRAVYDQLFSQTFNHPNFDPDDPRKTPLLDYLLEEHIVPHDEMMQVFQDFVASRGTRLWMYHNFDISRFDRWMLDRLQELNSQIREHASQLFAETAQEAQRRRLPLVLDEGGFFVAPLLSRWEESEQGLAFLEHMYRMAIEHQYWGFLATSYNGPEAPIWYAHPNWLKQNNTRFLKGKPSGCQTPAEPKE